MSYGDRDADHVRRSRVAAELDRREFWKDCFKISLSKNDVDDHADIEWAAKSADAALIAFESRFMREVK